MPSLIFSCEKDNTLSFIIKNADYYVATNGNDDNPGTFDHPWATWQKAISTVEAGDTVYIRGGIYEFPNADHGVYISDKNGTPDNPICIFNYPGETPVLNCRNQRIESSNNYGIAINECEYLHLKGLEVTNVLQPVSGSAQGFKSTESDNIIFENMKAHNVWGSGFVIFGHTGMVSFINCDSYDNYDKNTPGYAGGNADGFVGASTLRTSLIVFKGCRAWNNSDDGYDNWNHEGTVVYDSCWSFANGYNAGDGVGFKLGRTQEYPLETSQRTLTNCISFSNLFFGFSQSSGNVIMTFYNNMAYNNGSIGYSLGQYTNVMTFRNNISYNNGSADTFCVNAVHDHNSWNGGVTVTDKDFVSIDPSGINGARQIDGSLPNINFLKLATGSDLINAGIDVGLPFFGIAPDLGPFEKE